MRNKFADVIYRVGKKNKKICAIVADISPAGSIEKFRNEFPERFINCGVAEQSMIGIAAGMAMRGFRPFCYTIATFALYRPFEMIRVDLAYQNLPVTVVGMGAGLIYSTLGSTHQSFEDISISCSIPNMQVLAPCDPLEMEAATMWCATKNKGPVYMRLGKAGEPIITENAKEKFLFGKVRYLKKSKCNKLAIISYGTIMSMVFEIAENLKKYKINVNIISCHTLKPLDKKGIVKILNRYENVLIIEENVFLGSLSSIIKNINSDLKFKNSNIINFNCKDKFFHYYGSYKGLLSKHGISKNKIIKKILSLKSFCK
jgi:transketolase